MNNAMVTDGELYRYIREKKGYDTYDTEIHLNISRADLQDFENDIAPLASDEIERLQRFYRVDDRDLDIYRERLARRKEESENLKDEK